MLYMIRPGVAEKVEALVKAGGTFVGTYLSGIANESDLCFLNGFPGPLRTLMGLWAEEIDAIYDEEKVAVVATKGNGVGLAGRYIAGLFCDVIHAEAAKVLATYGSEFYKGSPALTVNHVGKGQAYYIASRNDRWFHDEFYGALTDKLSLPRALGTKLPPGVTAHVRTDGVRDVTFPLGFNRQDARVDLGRTVYQDRISRKRATGRITLPRYTAMILDRPVGPHEPGVAKLRRRHDVSQRYTVTTSALPQERVLENRGPPIHPTPLARRSAGGR